VGVVYTANTHLTIDERLLLYALVRGMRPQRVLEIGTLHGGSASIIASAMEDVGVGRVIGLDPVRAITTPRRRFHGRFEIIEKASPEGIADASVAAGGAFDLAHLDGINIYDQAKRDIEGVLPYMAPTSYILINNPFHYGVAQAIRESIRANSTLHDCGYVCTSADATVLPNLAYQGLQLLRVGPETSEPQPYIDRAFRALGKAPPSYSVDSLNDDVWYSRQRARGSATESD
jgi:predicted O-methyltransferase YrrM